MQIDYFVPTDRMYGKDVIEAYEWKCFSFADKGGMACAGIYEYMGFDVTVLGFPKIDKAIQSDPAIRSFECFVQALVKNHDLMHLMWLHGFAIDNLNTVMTVVLQQSDEAPVELLRDAYNYCLRFKGFAPHEINLFLDTSRDSRIVREVHEILGTFSEEEMKWLGWRQN